MSAPAKKSKKRKQSTPPNTSADGAQRLQRLLAAAGFGSRRQCEEMIEAGRVEVDGKVVTKLGTTADPDTQKVLVDGVILKKQKLVYYAVNKPTGVVTTNSDPHGRPRVVDLVPNSERVFAVGRLDRSSEGLILLTNDGDLAQRLTHPKFGVRKIYRVTVAGRVDGETMKQMRRGIYIAEGHVRVDGAKIFKSRSKATELEIVLREGKNREIRRILARLGHKVLQLRRIAVGPLRLGDMPAGAYRVVGRDEVKKLRTASEPSDDSNQPRGKRGGKGRTAKKRPDSKRPDSKRPDSKRPDSKRPDSKRPGGKPAAVKRPAKKRGASKRSDGVIDIGPIPGASSSRAGAVIGADVEQPAEKPKRLARKKGKTTRSGQASRGKKATSKSGSSKRTAGAGSRKSKGPSAKKSSSKKSSADRKPTKGRRGKVSAKGKPKSKPVGRKRKR